MLGLDLRGRDRSLKKPSAVIITIRVAMTNKRLYQNTLIILLLTSDSYLQVHALVSRRSIETNSCFLETCKPGHHTAFRTSSFSTTKIFTCNGPISEPCTSSSNQVFWNTVTSLYRGLATSLLFFFISFASTSLTDTVGLSSHSNNARTWTSSISIPPAWAEDELSSKYKTKGFDASLVDQSCLVNQCSLQAKACLAQDADCRKGLICTAKCLGDNSCITGCMARYGNDHLDDFLKCTIEDHSCIQVAILPGGMDTLDQAPLAPVPTISNFDLRTLEGPWYKVIGFNPNYDCYPCQRNTFSLHTPSSSLMSGQRRSDPPMLEVDVEFSMPRILPEGTIIPSNMERETVSFREDDNDDNVEYGPKGPLSIGLNDYQTHEVMVFDTPDRTMSRNIDIKQWLTLGKGTTLEKTYRRTAHSEGDMFGLKFWENWYIIGENDPGMQEFKFVYYNGKTRQNTYQGAFVYSRTKNLGPEALKKVYTIASEAGMNPRQFCKIQNGCFREENDSSGLGSPSNPFRGILASYKISQLLGVEPVAAEGVLKSTQTVSDKLRLKSMPGPGDSSDSMPSTTRVWHQELGDYLENPKRHFDAMDSLRVPMKWPDDLLDESARR